MSLKRKQLQKHETWNKNKGKHLLPNALLRPADITTIHSQLQQAASPTKSSWIMKRLPATHSAGAVANTCVGLLKLQK
jgi:hypothetical protein